MELIELRALIAVADEGGMQAAANRLGRSRPSISDYIRRLEEELGCPLLDRATRPIAPTPAGRVLIDEARTAITGIERAAGVAQRVAEAGTGVLRVGHNGPAGADHVQQAVAQLAGTDNAVTLQLREGPSNVLVDRLVERDLDLALVRPPIHHADIDETWLSEETFAVVVHAGHRLAANRTVDLVDLADEKFVLPARSLSSNAYDIIINACRTYGHFQPAVAQEATTTVSFLALVAAGTGIAMLPAQSLAYCRPRGIKRLRITNPLPGLPLHLAWHRSATNPYLHHLRTAIITAANPPKRRPAA